MINMKTIDR